jgi:hypothetical protein
MAEAKVRVTDKFFGQPNLPAPFSCARFRQRALSNSFLVASIYAWRGTRQLKPTLQYLLRAFTVDPANSPFIVAQLLSRFSRAIFSLLPRQWRRELKRLARRPGLDPRNALSGYAPSLSGMGQPVQSHGPSTAAMSIAEHRSAEGGDG